MNKLLKLKEQNEQLQSELQYYIKMVTELKTEIAELKFALSEVLVDELISNLN